MARILVTGSTGNNSLKTKSNPEDANGDYSIAEGYNTRTGGNDTYNVLSAGDITANGAYAHAEGNATIARGNSSHAEGKKTFADVDAAHAEGYNTVARGVGTHAEGQSTLASNTNAHAEGYHSIASGKYAHAEGRYTTSQNNAEHACGNYNVSHKASSTFGDSGNTSFSHGIGDSTTSRNSVEIMENGNMYMKGIGGYDGTSISGKQDVATIINQKANISGATNIRILTQSEYDSLTPEANTLYIIK